MPARLTESRKAWAAGFFDGEGTVGLYAKASRPSTFHLSVEITQKDSIPLALLQRVYGGTITTRREGGVSHWKTQARKASAFLEDIEPYLIVKRKQVLVALDFQARRGNSTRGDSTPERDVADALLLKELKRV